MSDAENKISFYIYDEKRASLVFPNNEGDLNIL